MIDCGLLKNSLHSIVFIVVSLHMYVCSINTCNIITESHNQALYYLAKLRTTLNTKTL